MFLKGVCYEVPELFYSTIEGTMHLDVEGLGYDATKLENQMFPQELPAHFCLILLLTLLLTKTPLN